MTKFRGVNLGGWLVLERWMTPSVFGDSSARDEYSLAADGGAEAIDEHRKTFITEADFAWLAEHGINAVRIPVGYWIFDGVFDADVSEAPSIGYLDQAMEWAKTHSIAVLIDLHGAPGSQNGRDHSGQIGTIDWWRGDNQPWMIETLKQLAARYYDNEVLWGIEIVNEPARGKVGWRLMRLYRRAYRALRQTARPGTHIVFADGFAPWLLTGALRGRSDFPVVMDCHFYQIFGAADKRRSLAGHLAKARARRGLVRKLRLWQPVIVGEWSGALPIRATPEETREYIEAQQQGFQDTLGWFYWTYKMEGGGGWNFRKMVDEKIITLDQR